MSKSSSSLEKATDEYQDVSSGSGGSYENGEGSTNSSSSSSDEHYSFGVPSFSLEEFQEMQRRRLLGLGLARPEDHLALFKTKRKRAKKRRT